MLTNIKELTTLGFETQADWRKWLDTNHRKSPGLWLKLAKKASKAAIGSVAHSLRP